MVALCFLHVALVGDSAGDAMRVNPSFVYLFLWVFIYFICFTALFIYCFIFFCIYCIIMLLLTYFGYTVSFVMLGWVITFDKSYTRTWDYI